MNVLKISFISLFALFLFNNLASAQELNKSWFNKTLNSVTDENSYIKGITSDKTKAKYKHKLEERKKKMEEKAELFKNRSKYKHCFLHIHWSLVCHKNQLKLTVAKFGS